MDPSLAAILGACAVALCGGFLKGAIGFGLPLVMVSGMGLFLPPASVVAALILPIVLSNGLQTLRGGLGPAREAIVEHWRYIAIVCAMIAVSAQFLLRIPEGAMFLVLGVPVTILSLIQLLGLRLRIAPGRRRLAEWSIGGLAGAIGGLSGTWGPPTVLYLVALETPRARQLVVQGVVYGLGSVVLLGAHLASGVLNAATAPLSALLVAPALAGMWLGFRLGDRLNPETFRRATLAVLVLAGLNLIRRGLAA